MKCNRLSWLGLGVIAMAGVVQGQETTAPLPPVLQSESGQAITNVREWETVRRPELLELFRQHVYGRAPVDRPAQMQFTVVQEEVAIQGRAIHKEVDIQFTGPGGSGTIRLHLFVPQILAAQTATTAATTKPAPVFVLVCNREKGNIDPTRQHKSPFWPVEEMVQRGYAAAAFHNGDVDPDKFDHFQDGVHGIFDDKSQPRPADAWGTIAAWAWGASRVMDYLETDPHVDARRVAIIGHSRGGKTALWCGASDPRFALVISNNSGCSGAALARRDQGETVKQINDRFPHWFCTNYRQFNDQEEKLPVDQHQLIALMAPRAVYVASASEDAWADPKGEFLACVQAAPVYELYGLPTLGTTTFPKPGQALHQGRIAYHLRPGKHDLNLVDWNFYMDYADKLWKTEPLPTGN